jgi:hypothetical protein
MGLVHVSALFGLQLVALRSSVALCLSILAVLLRFACAELSLRRSFASPLRRSFALLFCKFFVSPLCSSLRFSLFVSAPLR